MRPVFAERGIVPGAAGRAEGAADLELHVMMIAMSPEKPTARTRPQHAVDRWGVGREVRDLLVAVTGGAIVGMPLLYTMEMWLHGMLLGPAHQLLLLLGILVVNLLFSIVSGFRHEYGVKSALLESVTAVGIGLVFSAFILWLVGEIGPDVAWPEITGKVLFETTAVSIGVSIADDHVRGKRRAGNEGATDDANDAGQQREGAHDSKPGPGSCQLESWQLRQDIRDITATLTGAMVYSINIGPTEEVVMIAGRLTPWQLGGVVLGSLALCYIILYASGIKDHPVHIPSLVQSPPAETIITYAASLGVAVGLIWVLGERESVGSLENFVSAIIVLGLPASVGGAAGRIAL